MVKSMVKAATAGAIILAATLSVGAQGNSKKPVITAAQISLDQSSLWVEGENFGRNPTVVLDGMQLGGVQVDATGRHVIAVMPSLPPGTYKLEIGTRGNQSAELSLTVGAVGPPGRLARMGREDRPDEPGRQGLRGRTQGRTGSDGR